MSQVTIEAIDKVLERLPKATYKQAKEALQKTDGNVRAMRANTLSTDFL